MKFLGGIRTEGGRIDLKRAGLFGVVSAARAMAIRHHVTDRSTKAGLAGVKTRLHVSETDLDALAQAHGVFLDLIVSQQVEDVTGGIPPSNAVWVNWLSTHDRDRLRAALEAVASVDELARDVLFKRLSAWPGYRAASCGAHAQRGEVNRFCCRGDICALACGRRAEDNCRISLGGAVSQSRVCCNLAQEVNDRRCQHPSRHCR